MENLLQVAIIPVTIAAELKAILLIVNDCLNLASLGPPTQPLCCCGSLKLRIVPFL
jgi:hypothetical protein